MKKIKRRYQQLNKACITQIDKDIIKETKFTKNLREVLIGYADNEKIINLDFLDLKDYTLVISHTEVKSLLAIGVIATEGINNGSQEAGSNIDNSEQYSKGLICNSKQHGRYIDNYNQVSKTIINDRYKEYKQKLT